MKYAVIVATVFFATNSFAATNAYWNSARQISTVVESKELSEKLLGNLTDVRKTDDLTFDVYTEKCVTHVKLDAHIPDQPGPTDYTINTIGNVYCEE